MSGGCRVGRRAGGFWGANPAQTPRTAIPAPPSVDDRLAIRLFFGCSWRREVIDRKRTAVRLDCRLRCRPASRRRVSAPPVDGLDVRRSVSVDGRTVRPRSRARHSAFVAERAWTNVSARRGRSTAAAWLLAGDERARLADAWSLASNLVAPPRRASPGAPPVAGAPPRRRRPAPAARRCPNA